MVTSVIGRLAAYRPLARARIRAALFGGLIAVSLILALFPERHLAATSLTPASPDTLGLSRALGQLGAINNVFGNQAEIEVALRIAKSVYVRDAVIKELKLHERLGEPDRERLHRRLQNDVEIRSLRGGIISIEMTDRDAKLARDIVAAYCRAAREQLADISQRQTAYKRDVLLKLVSEAADRLAKAQSAYDGFRLTARYVDPQTSIQAVAQRIPAIEAEIEAKGVELDKAQKLYTENHLIVKQIKSQITSLQGQLAKAKTTSTRRDNSVGRVVSQSSQLFKLERDLRVARLLYDSYLGYLQGTAVEDLTSTASIRVLEPAYIDTRRQYFLPALASAIGFLLLWLAIEFYRLRPPVGAKLEENEAHD